VHPVCPLNPPLNHKLPPALSSPSPLPPSFVSSGVCICVAPLARDLITSAPDFFDDKASKDMSSPSHVSFSVQTQLTCTHARPPARTHARTYINPSRAIIQKNNPLADCIVIYTPDYLGVCTLEHM